MIFCERITSWRGSSDFVVKVREVIESEISNNLIVGIDTFIIGNC